MSAIAAVTMLPAALSAQTSDLGPRHVALVGGALHYDNGYDSGTGGAIGVHFDFPGSPFMLLEPSLTYLWFPPDSGEAAPGVLMPELQVQAELGERVRPFIGVGAGWAFAPTYGLFGAAIVLSAGGGIRAQFSQQWGGRAEVRLRGFNSVRPTATEVTIGVSRTF